jgi:hypothetical protein
MLQTQSNGMVQSEQTGSGLMVSGGVLVVLGLVVWFLSYGPRGPAVEPEAAPDGAFADLAALFDQPSSPPDRTTHLR